MGADGTELNLDGISKPELEKIGARAADITGLELKLELLLLDTLKRTLDEHLQAGQSGRVARVAGSL